MNKLTDAEIVKALEVHSNDKYDNCEGCPYLKNDCCEGFTVYSEPYREVLDLINRQKAEIERLDKLVIYNASCCTRLHKELFNAKTEAIKEFAEKLTNRICENVNRSLDNPNGNNYYPIDVYEDIDNLVKEMVGEPQKIEHNSLCETETYKGGE